jgi:Zn-dependent peptidase ImmA (M78 family)/DNA-binding transcriptional regulator YiaG
VTDNPSRGRPKKGGDQLTVWGPEPEAETNVSPPETREPRHRQLALINPAIAEWARKTANIPVERAATRLRIKPMTLIAWETGAARPTIPQLRRLAHLYKRPLAAFYLPAAPRHFTVAKDFRRLPDQPPIAYSTELLFALRIADYRRDVVLGLEPETAPASFVGSSTADEGPIALARRARVLLGVSLDEQRAWDGEYPALNGWKNAIEGLGALVFHFSHVDEAEVRGFSISERRLPVIALNGGDSVTARIFTLIHEFGHLLLGEGGSCDLADYSRPSARSLPVEVFCNAFAGSVLVPAEALLDDRAVAAATNDTEWSDAELERLARRFRVSREVVLRRLLSLNRANEEFYRTWRSELLALPARDDERSKGRPGVAVITVRDVGKPFARLVLDAYRTNDLTGGDVSELLGVRLKHLPAIEARLAGADMLTGGER